jgi:hypothetical protein
VEDFLALFPAVDGPDADEEGVSEHAADELRAYATGGIVRALQEAEEDWTGRREEVRRRIAAIDEAAGQLAQSDDSQDRERRELLAERRAAGDLLRELSQSSAHATLVDLGLLPNYSLADTTTRLEATLYWSETPDEEDGPAEGTRPAAGAKVCRSETRDYERSSALALTELAPGNSFYVNGYRHVVRALDIGGPDRRAWSVWRLCPACGYVRTEDAERDTAPCPRCRGREIADAGCVQYVLRPRRVLSRDKREDARVRDDRDERDRRHYATLTTVDIDPDRLVPGSWRHDEAVFGVDFTRHATIRTLNLGLDREDGSSTVPLAGEDVRLNPFYVCTSCGGATADGRPVVDVPQHALTESGATSTPASAHHLLWCPRRRARGAAAGTARAQDAGRDVPLLLAHELTTEAVRILLPASVARFKERLASFTAALFTGIAARYGGDPDHIDIAEATMPDDAGDPDADWPRRFLVVYDRLPGGTGYLHRLASADGFREVLLRAREVIERCPCQEKGMDGCHQCLLRRVPAADYDRVSRKEVRQMLDDLLGADGERWRTSRVTTTQDIPIQRQAESDLEVLFVETLRDWAKLPESKAAADAYTTSAGTYALDLRLTAPDGSTVSWRVSQQRALDGTRPDILLERLDSPGPRVALYLDGYAYHATREHNRLADDAVKRTRLRADGLRVFQLTYHDVMAWRRRINDTGHAGTDADTSVWTPYGTTGRQRARDYYDRVGRGLPGELAETMWVNPARMLLAYLRSPDPDRWRRRAEAVAAGMSGADGIRGAALTGTGAAAGIREVLRGGVPAGTAGPVRMLYGSDASGCRLVLAADGRRTPPVWTGLAVLDDGVAALEEGPAHKRRWRAWLWWGNVLQFLEHGGGDSAQLTSGMLDGFAPEALTVTGGEGWLSSMRVPVPRHSEEPSAVAASAVPAVPAVTVDEIATREPEAAERHRGTDRGRDPRWDRVIELLDPEEPGLAALAHALASAAVPVPQDGYELDGHGWQAELAWPDARIGVVRAPRPVADEPDYEAEDQKRAFEAAGWSVRTAADWDGTELIARLDGRRRDKDTDSDGEPKR